MKSGYFYTVLILFIFQSLQLFSQTDTILPATPKFNLLTVSPETGLAELSWSTSPSPDVAGYLIYYYRNGAGFSFDTVNDPFADSYVNRGSFASKLSESYEIAAIDSSGNKSPLSWVLTTMFAESSIDTCNRTILLQWNKYSPYPYTVNSYQILVSMNGGSFTVAGETSPSDNSFTISDFITGMQYCFEIKAVLEGSLFSYSNKTCLTTGTERPPQWINADYATVNDSGHIALSFTIDPLSEIVKFILERKTDGESTFTKIAQIVSDDGKISYTDQSGDPLLKNYYRLSAVNNCGIPVITSNLAGNIVAGIRRADDFIYLFWNRYRSWTEGVWYYKVFIDTGSGFILNTQLSSSDTSLSISYHDLMYDITESEICFYVSATAITNLYNIGGESSSAPVCAGITERITAPTAFTPDNNLVNDLFSPFLSFTPLEYHLIITDRQNNVLFESTDYNSKWDGTRNGNPRPQGVYLWFLKVKTPSGRTISKNGTVTLLKNR